MRLQWLRRYLLASTSLPAILTHQNASAWLAHLRKAKESQ